jgi:hypothetical protein
MTATESQDIILYVPKSNVLAAVLMGICLPPIGIIIPFLAGWQFLALLLSLFLIIVGVWLGPVFAWKMIHNPILIINAEGIGYLNPSSRKPTQFRWEEIDSIYHIDKRNGAVFAVDLSPVGLISFFSRQGGRIPRRIDITAPQLALGIPDTNLPLPVDQLLAQVRERFSVQLERYNIDLDYDREEGQEPR